MKHLFVFFVKVLDLCLNMLYNRVVIQSEWDNTDIRLIDPNAHGAQSTREPYSQRAT